MRIIKNTKKAPKYYYLVFFGMLLTLGVGYSVINSSLEMEGTVTAEKKAWDVYFDNVDVKTGSVNTDSPVTITDGTNLDFSVILSSPGDKYEFTFDIINNGDLVALIETINKTSLSEEQQKRYNYTVTYEDGTEIAEGDLLKPGQSKKAHVLIEYKKLFDKNYLDEDVNLVLTMGLKYYFPREEKYTVSLTHNGSIKNYETVNTSQEIVINNFEIDNDDQFIKCSNGVIPSYQNNIMKLSNIKSSSECVIYNSTDSERTLSLSLAGTTDLNSYILFLNDFENNMNGNSAYVNASKKATIDLNGKTLTVNISSSYSSSCFFNNNGNLKIIDSKGGAVINSNGGIFYNSGNLTVTGGSYVLNNPVSTNYARLIKYEGGTMNLLNSTYTSDSVPALIISSNSSSTTIDISIDNCTITSSGTATSTVLFSTNYGSEIDNINIKNSRIVNNYSDGIAFNYNNGYGSNLFMFVCNSEIQAGSYDISGLTTSSKFFYSNDTLFTNNSNIPNINNTTESKVIKADFACY